MRCAFRRDSSSSKGRSTCHLLAHRRDHKQENHRNGLRPEACIACCRTPIAGCSIRDRTGNKRSGRAHTRGHDQAFRPQGRTPGATCRLQRHLALMHRHPTWNHLRHPGPLVLCRILHIQSGRWSQAQPPKQESPQKASAWKEAEYITSPRAESGVCRTLARSASAATACSTALCCKPQPKTNGSVDSHHGAVIQTTDGLPDLVASNGSDLVDHDLRDRSQPIGICWING